MKINKKRVTVAGSILVVAAATATYASTAGNTLPAEEPVAGYGATSVTGVDVTKIEIKTGGKNQATEVVWKTSNVPADAIAKMYVNNSVVAITCTIVEQDIECPINEDINTLDGLALQVVGGQVAASGGYIDLYY